MNFDISWKPKPKPKTQVLADQPKVLSHVAAPSVSTQTTTETAGEQAQVADARKRMFLRLAGLGGVGLVLSALLPKKAQALVMGSTPAASVVGVKDSANVRIDPAKETGGNLADIKTNTDPLVAAAAGGYVRQDSTATIAKETGGNLADIKTNTDKFKFDGDNLMVTSTGGGGGGAVTVLDTTGKTINPVSDDAVVYLRRMVKLLESNATVDAANRQRVTIDGAGAGFTVPVSATLNNLTTIAGQNQQMYQDVARNAYANGIRQNLIWS